VDFSTDPRVPIFGGRRRHGARFATERFRTFQGGSTVLIITRRAGERIMVGDDIVVEIMEIVGNSVRVGIQAPRSVPVYREEIYAAVREENRAAAESSPAQLPHSTETAS
jgi:carbon storage regulator